MAVKFEIRGVQETINFLHQKSKDIVSAQEKAMNQVALFMEGEVKESIAGRKAEPRSVDTGRFLNSVKGTSELETAVIQSELEYSEFLEYGTSKISPRSHFRNSLDRNHVKIREFLDKEIKIAVK